MNNGQLNVNILKNSVLPVSIDASAVSFSSLDDVQRTSSGFDNVLTDFEAQSASVSGDAVDARASFAAWKNSVATGMSGSTLKKSILQTLNAVSGRARNSSLVSGESLAATTIRAEDKKKCDF